MTNSVDVISLIDILVVTSVKLALKFKSRTKRLYFDNNDVTNVLALVTAWRQNSELYLALKLLTYFRPEMAQRYHDPKQQTKNQKLISEIILPLNRY